MAFSNAKENLPKCFEELIEVNHAIADLRKRVGNVIQIGDGTKEGFRKMKKLKAEQAWRRQECQAFIAKQRGDSR